MSVYRVLVPSHYRVKVTTLTSGLPSRTGPFVRCQLNVQSKDPVETQEAQDFTQVVKDGPHNLLPPEPPRSLLSTREQVGSGNTNRDPGGQPPYSSLATGNR